MRKHYAILGWGSLIWDLEILAPHVDLPWQMGAGPLLPMEFTRISPKRKLGLAVCVDERHGVACPTHAIASRRDSLDAAMTDLAARERAPVNLVGGVCMATRRHLGRSAIADRVSDWCTATGWQGAVWTDLRPNYAETRGNEFSVDDAVAYLASLRGESLNEAVRYIENAPEQTDTPLRRTLAGLAWWRSEAARVSEIDAASSSQ